MVCKRFAADACADPALLAQPLHFRTAGRSAKNRLLKSALSETAASFTPAQLQTHGVPTQRLVNLYEKWGRGGFGLVLSGNFMVDHRHLESAANVIVSRETDSAEKDRMLAAYANAIKQDGTLAIAQVGHAGRQTPFVINPTPFSASDVQLHAPASFGNTYGPPVPLSKAQLRAEVVDRFVFAARKCWQAGFDGVQLHGAHGYLLAQFLSATTNRRTDEYGGSAANRVRLLVEVYQAIRKEIPASTGFIIGAKLNSVEFQDGGVGIEDAIVTAKAAESAGFDFIEFSGGTYEKLAFHHLKDSTRKREAFFADFVEAIKPHLRGTVVYLTGGFRTLPAMVRAVREGVTDGVGFGRPASAEPDFPAKLLSGRIDAVPLSTVDDDFRLSAGVCKTQMAQAGDSTAAQCADDACRGIMDCSDARELAAFSAAYAAFAQRQLAGLRERNEPLRGFCDYRPRFAP